MGFALLNTLATTTATGWRPGIGDPTILGWATVVAYFAAALLCFCAGRRARRRSASAPATSPLVAAIWFVMAALLLALGINKQLDLQTLLTEIGREMAKSDGWYPRHRVVQFHFILGVAAAGLTCLASFLFVARRHLRELGLPLVGATFLVAFVVTRAASFHHINALLGTRWLGVKANVALELGGILTILAGALRALARRGRPWEPPFTAKPPPPGLAQASAPQSHAKTPG